MSDGHISGHRRGSRPKVAIIGAGAIGLGIGWRLAAAGAMVDIFERGEAGRGASWAAAGMLAADLEAEPGEERLHALNQGSVRRWPAFAEELEAAAGFDVELRREGTLSVASTADEAELLRHQGEYQRGIGIELQWLTASELRRREPRLAPGIVAAAFSPRDLQVNNRRLTAALETAFRRAGGRLHPQASVSSISIENGRATGVRSGGELCGADVIVLAAGAWSREIGGIPQDALPPVRPIKGQMLALRMDPSAPLIQHVIWAPGVYLVPRRHGTLIAGATVEERGFDPSLTAGAMLSLLHAAWRVLPDIAELAIAETWSGFRPGSPDDAPILGPSAIDGLVLATGHHRNGILLTPVTADEICRCVLDGRASETIRPFGVDRFRAKTPRPSHVGTPHPSPLPQEGRESAAATHRSPFSREGGGLAGGEAANSKETIDDFGAAQRR
jgi:glycine oxidase